MFEPILSFAVAIAQAGAAAALPATPPPAAPTDALAGIWEGNVGTLPVRACFTRGERRTFGAYYYQSRMRLIALENRESPEDMFEEGGGGGAGPGANAARWRIERAGATQLTASWTQGNRTLPVRLRRIARQTGEANPCTSIVFHRPRLAGVRAVRSRARADGVAYTRFRLDNRGRFAVNVDTFALDGNGAAVRRINTALGQGLAGNPPGWFDCISNSLEMMPYEGESNESLEPVMFSRRWLSVAAHGDWSCGGAHPDADNSYLTYDLTTGAEVRLLGWFSTRAVKRERVRGAPEIYLTLEPAFRTFILSGRRATPDTAECDEVIQREEYWNAGLTRDGFVFTPQLPHVVQACEEAFTIRFDRLAPWLTPQGAAHVRALRAERSRRTS
jgi:hypothetical protein